MAGVLRAHRQSGALTVRIGGKKLAPAIYSRHPICLHTMHACSPVPPQPPHSCTLCIQSLYVRAPQHRRHSMTPLPLQVRQFALGFGPFGVFCFIAPQSAPGNERAKVPQCFALMETRHRRLASTAKGGGGGSRRLRRETEGAHKGIARHGAQTCCLVTAQQRGIAKPSYHHSARGTSSSRAGIC